MDSLGHLDPCSWRLACWNSSCPPQDCGKSQVRVCESGGRDMLEFNHETLLWQRLTHFEAHAAGKDAGRSDDVRDRVTGTTYSVYTTSNELRDPEAAHRAIFAKHCHCESSLECSAYSHGMDQNIDALTSSSCTSPGLSRLKYAL